MRYPVPFGFILPLLSWDCAQGPVLCLCAQERYFSVILARTTINMFTGGVSVMLNRKTNVLIAAFYLVVLKNKMVL